MENLNAARRECLKKKSTLEEIITNYLVLVGSEAVQYQDKIFSVEEKQINSKSLKPKEVNAYLLRIGMSQTEIDALFKKKIEKIRNVLKINNTK